MLIVAIPKSASTSLMDAIAELHGVKAKQSFPKHLSRIKGLSVLSNYHSDIRELDKPFVDEILAKDKQINKQHIAPTANNISFIAEAGIRPVILLRDPCGIVDA